MSNIIKTIETKSANVHKFIKGNSQEVAARANEWGAKKEELKTDDFREWAFANEWGFMFDEISEKTDKPIMSQHAKNVSSGMCAIYSDNAVFFAWSDSEHGKHTTGLAKMKMTLTAFAKSLEASDDTGADDDAGDDGADDAGDDASPENVAASLEDIARKLVADLGNDAALELSTMIYDIACGDASEEAVAAVS